VVEAATEKENTAQKALDAVQRTRARWAWALASIFALIVCGILGLGLIESVASVETSDGGAGKSLFERVDVIITGLAVGAGTKPLHDLISRLEKSKDKADPATDPAGGKPAPPAGA
jgi:hypothetical protein